MAIIAAETPQEHLRNVANLLLSFPAVGGQVVMAESDRAAMMERLLRAAQQLEGRTTQ